MDDKISRVAAVEATAAGAKAARDGKSVTDCPHEGDDLAAEFRAHHWIKGFRAASHA